MGVYPNMSQFANTLAFAGFKKAFRGLTMGLSTAEKKHVQQAVGLMEGTQVIMNNVGGRLGLGATSATMTAAGRVADRAEIIATSTLKLTGFSLVEARNRTLSGMVGKYIFRDNIQKLSAGKLRGNSFDAAMKQMDSLGISPSQTKELVRRHQTEGSAFLDSAAFRDLETRAIFRAAQLTQFTPGNLRRPEFWNHPVGKVLTQFKSFALNQGRFMKDQILAEASRGNMAPLAYVLSVYPIAGELVGDMKSIVKQKPRDADGIDRVLENFTQMGGFGLMHNAITSAQWRGGLLRDVAGPTLGDMADFAEFSMSGEPQKIVAEFVNDPTVQNAKFFTLAGAAAAMKLNEVTGDPVSHVGDLLKEFRKNR